MRAAKDDQFGDIERNRLIKHSKRIGQNERESLKLQTKLCNLVKL